MNVTGSWSNSYFQRRSPRTPSRVGLHPREDMLVDLHGEGDAAAAESFADDLIGTPA